MTGRHSVATRVRLGSAVLVLTGILFAALVVLLLGGKVVATLPAAVGFSVVVFAVAILLSWAVVAAVNWAERRDHDDGG